MPIQPKYLLLPGYVTSKTDGEEHYIPASQLIRLYGVSGRECVVWYEDRSGPIPSIYDHLIPLRPKHHGDYERCEE